MKKKKSSRRRSERERVEMMLGRKLLKGDIPVVPPSKLKLPRCPIPNGAQGFEKVCEEYDAGKISYDDVLAKVGESMKKPETKDSEVQP